MIGFDIETTGIDLWHGCTPFAMAAAHESGLVDYWQWPVDPYTRRVLIKSAEIEQVADCLGEPIVCHNATFDVRGTELLFQHPHLSHNYTFDWEAIEDTLLASHCLRNLWSHGLKSLRRIFLLMGNPVVDLLQKAVNHARRICRRANFIKEYGPWRIADSNDPDWPAIKKAPAGVGWWVFDMWLPAAIASHAPSFLPDPGDYHQPFLWSTSGKTHRDGEFHQATSPGAAARFHLRHPWEVLVQEYCIEDAQSTLVLWSVLQDALKEEGLWDQYLERKEILQVAYRMETTGVHVLPTMASELERYRRKALFHRKRVECELAASGIPEPNMNSAAQLRKYLFETYKLPIHKRTSTGLASTDAETLEKLAEDAADASVSHQNKTSVVLHDILSSRRNAKAGDDYLLSYMQWSTPYGQRDILARTIANVEGGNPPSHPEVGNGRQPKHPAGKGHPTLSKRDGHHFRGPGTSNHAWQGGWVHANTNITGTRFTRQSSSNPNLQNVGTGKEEEGEIDFRLRLGFGPAPDRVWLSYDYSNIELRIWAYLCGNREFIQAFQRDESVHLLIARELHPELRDMDDDSAQRTKAYKYTKNGDFAVIFGASPPKADLTYKVPHASDRIADRFPEVRIFTKQLHQEVKERGYIETLTGYRLYIPPDDPHKAVSGKIQGTAGSVIGRAMINTNRVLRENYPAGELILQIHDELVFDIPVNYPTWLPNRLRDAMTCIGEDIGIPLKVGTDLIVTNWAEGTAL